MRIDSERKLDFDDVLIRPKRSRLKTRAGVDLVRTFKLPHGKGPLVGVPVIAANMDSVGTFNMARALSEHQMFTAVHKYYTIEQWQEAKLPEHAFVTFGMESVDKITDTLKKLGRTRLCLDIANGYTEMFVDLIRDIRAANPDIVLMAGNVATPDMTEALILAGADIVKVGIGPGSVCTTRMMTGVGYPQLSAVIECADAAHGLGGLICADGGCKTPGDVAKAFAAGADFVMLGGMLAGHTEALSDDQLAKIKDGDNTLEYYGMSSATAMNRYSGGVAKHRAAEGRVQQIQYKGDVAQAVQDILGGVRSACTYVGAGNLKELTKRTTFVIKN